VRSGVPKSPNEAEEAPARMAFFVGDWLVWQLAVLSSKCYYPPAFYCIKVMKIADLMPKTHKTVDLGAEKV